MWSRMNTSEEGMLWVSRYLNSSSLVSMKTAESESLETPKQRQDHLEMHFYSYKLKISSHLLKKASNVYFYLEWCVWETIRTELWKANNKIQLLNHSGKVVSVMGTDLVKQLWVFQVLESTHGAGETHETKPSEGVRHLQTEHEAAGHLGCFKEAKEAAPWAQRCARCRPAAGLHRAEAISALIPVGVHRTSRICDFMVFANFEKLPAATADTSLGPQSHGWGSFRPMWPLCSFCVFHPFLSLLHSGYFLQPALQLLILFYAESNLLSELVFEFLISVIIFLRSRISVWLS